MIASANCTGRYMQLLQSHTAYQPNPSLTSSFIFMPLTRTIAISDGKLTCEEWVVKVWNVARQAEVCSYRISINEAGLAAREHCGAACRAHRGVASMDCGMLSHRASTWLLDVVILQLEVFLHSMPI